MATVNLGSIKFNWRGAWSSSTAYAVDDVVSLSGSSYISIQAGTNQNPSTATAYWEQMSSAGTDGTDLTTTLTTQGDIVYRDGSGLARLGAGTSGQVLQTGGSGANPSWTNVSSDWVKLGSTTLSSDTAQLDFDNLFDYSTYKYYVIQFAGHTSVSGGWVNGRAIDSAGNIINSNQYTAIGRFVVNSGGSGASTSSDWNGDRFYLVQCHNSASKPSVGNLYIHNADSTTQGKFITNLSIGWDGGTQIQASSGGHFWDSTGTMRGFRFYCNGGTLKSGFRAELYGVK